MLFPILKNHLEQHLGAQFFPQQLAQQEPKLFEHILESWQNGTLDTCFRELLIADQQQTRIFSPEIAQELFRLQICLDGLSPPNSSDVWAHIPQAPVDPVAQKTLINLGHPVSNQGLERAIEQRQYGLMPAFVRAGIAVDHRDQSGWTPLMYACFAGQLDTAIQLIELGANLPIRDQHGYSLIHWAALNGNGDLVALLIGHGLSPTLPSHRGITPLMQAAAGGYTKAMQHIVAQGGIVALDARSDESWTALHKAVANRQFAAAVWLAEQGANPYIQHQNGDSACKMALDSNQHRLYELLSQIAERQGASMAW